MEEPVAGLWYQPGEGDLAGGGIGEGFLEIEVRGSEGQREEEGDEGFSHGGDVGKREGDGKGGEGAFRIWNGKGWMGRDLRRVDEGGRRLAARRRSHGWGAPLPKRHGDGPAASCRVSG